MKRLLLGSFACLAIGLALVVLDARWPALFCMMVVSMGVYLLFGRKADVEFRIGPGGAEERRLHGALAWRHRDRVLKSPDGSGSDETEAGIIGRDG